MLSLLITLARLARAVVRAWHDTGFRAIVQLYVLLLASGTLFYWRREGWTPLDALYFSVTTLSTVGLGDLAPRTAEGKVFTVVYVLTGTGVFVALATSIAAAVVRRERALDPPGAPPARGAAPPTPAARRDGARAEASRAGTGAAGPAGEEGARRGGRRRR